MINELSMIMQHHCSLFEYVSPACRRGQVVAFELLNLVFNHLAPLTAKLFNLNFHPLEIVSR